EVASVYHGLQHHHSYLSTDCGIKLSSKMFNDSMVSKEIRCGRTKAEAIVKNVLSPKSIEMVINDVKPLEQDPLYFSIASDASNNGNQKLFPIAIQYFTRKSGVQNKLLDFFEDPKEESCDIYTNIRSCLDNYNLDILLVSAYSADNANVNYGVRNSVQKK
ncbi:GSCOCG00013361001-RA-CDS, partial [Cotesia congregata]